MKNFFIFFILITFTACSQREKIFYVEDVDYMEYLTLNYCVDSQGKTTKVSVVSENTTYSNQEVIDQIVKKQKEIEYIPNVNNVKCYDEVFTFINSTLRNSTVHEKSFTQLEKFKIGHFKYLDPNYKNVTVIRSRNLQIEEMDGKTTRDKLEWIQPNIYTITPLDDNNNVVGEKKSYCRNN